jgi:hypothetical protein
MTGTDPMTAYVAIYSAIVSTAVACWQIYVRFSDGPRLRGTARGNMKLAGSGQIDPKTYIVINVANIGNRASTIQVVGVYTCASWLRRLRGKHDDTAYVINTAGHLGHAVPHVLEPGHTFMGVGAQTPDIVKLTRERLTYITVSHSMSRRGLLVRLRPIEDLKEV